MTWASWRGTGGVARSEAETPQRRDVVPLLGLWHVLCCVVGGTSCYYGPVDPVTQNQPPELASWSDPPGDAILLDRSPTKVWVSATDAEGDPLTFLWLLSEDGPLRDALSDQISSQVDLWPEEGLEAQVLSVEVRDGQDITTTSWPLELP